MDSNVAAFAFGAAIGLESDLLGSTTLCIRDNRSAGGTFMHLFACRIVWHSVVTFDVHIVVLVGRDLISLD